MSGGSEREMEAALADLGHWRAEVRAAAVARFISIGAPAVPRLVELVEEAPTEAVAIAAIRALGAVGEPGVEPLTALLHGSDPALAREAAAALRVAGTPGAIRALGAAVVKGDQRVAAAPWRVGLWMSALVIAICGGIAMGMLADPLLVLLVPVALVLLAELGRRMYAALDPTAVCRAALHALEGAADASLLCPVVRMLGSDADREAAAVLLRLLPRLRASDALQLPNDVMQRMLTKLLHGPTRLQVAILEALQQIGDERAVSTVEAVAAGRCPGATATRVRQAAVECLPFLLAHIEARRHADLLVRAALPDTSNLVRPAADAQREDTALVRPAEGDGA